MNKETKIAKQNIEVLRSFEVQGGDGDKDVCIEHKQTCQRWLEFLENIVVYKYIEADYQSKIKDLKQTIKLYDEVEIE